MPRRHDDRPAATADPPDTDTGSDEDVLVDVRDLKVHFPLHGGFFGRLVGRELGSVKAVDGVSFGLRRGEVLGLVGESGSGKTTLGRALLGLVRATGGSIRYDGRELTGLSDAQYRPLRRRFQMVFQDPHASLNPAMTLLQAVGHPLRIHRVTRDPTETRRRVSAALERVGLAPAERYLDKYPGDLSGGQKQRAVLARATILDPELLVADEPVSMLDMSVRAKILELMLELRRDLRLTYVYVTHDLATAKFFCDRIAIMYLGRIVEIGPAERIYADPKHPYTQSLLKAIPEPDPTRQMPRDLPRGEVPDAVMPPLGCSFHPRCPKAFERCGWESRDLRALLEEHWTRLDAARYERESAMFARLDRLDAPSTEARLTAASGHSGDDLAAVLDRVREEDPDEPLWRGVEKVTTDADGVTVRFRPGDDPRPQRADAVDVACHLYD